MNTYQPSKEILEKYADLLINYAVNKCKGIKPGQVILLQVPECAKPFLLPLQNAVLKAGANPIIQFLPDGNARDYYLFANDSQIKFFPDKYFKGIVEQIDHRIYIIADANPKELIGINPKKLMLKQKTMKQYGDWMREKENKGEFTWCLAMYGTPGMAKEAGLSLKEYWNQIIRACYLDKENPIKEWKRINAQIKSTLNKLNSLKIEKLRMQAPKTDIIIGLGKNRKWLGGRGANLPSFEVFISPDAKKTEGKVQFTEPLYRYGNLITNVYLEFKNGEVVKVRADKGENLLKEMIKTPGANRIGEFSLTDARLSRITKFMAETLFDENVGGKYGNTHIALGAAYKDSFPGDPSKVQKSQWKKMGYNDSSIHTDIVATSNRTVTAFLPNKEEKIIYKNGKFVI